MCKIISVVGPTATGKTALSLALAEHFDGEIVSVDSMQIYKKMNIGTAKVTAEEQQRARHHLIDCLEPNENCNVQKFVTMARRAVDDILSRSKSCILAGGTGLYVDHLISDTKFVDIPYDDSLRRELNAKSESELYIMLSDLDPPVSKRLHINDKKRIVRALEVILLTGKSIAHWEELSHKDSRRLNAIMIGLNFANRDELYARIDKRVDIMIEQGLVQEVEQLTSIEGFLNSTAAAAIGYKEILQYLQGEISLDRAVELIKMNTRRYAKRQLTWFRRNPDIHWINITAQTPPETVAEIAVEIAERN